MNVLNSGEDRQRVRATGMHVLFHCQNGRHQQTAVRYTVPTCSILTAYNHSHTALITVICHIYVVYVSLHIENSY